MATPVTLNRAAPGGDWAVSKVVVEIPTATTSAISYQGLAIIEIKIDDPDGIGEKTFFTTVKIRKGNID